MSTERGSERDQRRLSSEGVNGEGTDLEPARERPGFMARVTHGFGGVNGPQADKEKDRESAEGKTANGQGMGSSSANGREMGKAYERDREMVKEREMEMHRLRERERIRSRERSRERRDRQGERVRESKVGRRESGDGRFPQDGPSAHGRKESVYAPESWAEAIRKRESEHLPHSYGGVVHAGSTPPGLDIKRERSDFFRRESHAGWEDSTFTPISDRHDQVSLPPLRFHLRGLDTSSPSSSLPTSTYPYQIPSGSSSSSLRSSPEYSKGTSSNRHPSDAEYAYSSSSLSGWERTKPFSPTFATTAQMAPHSSSAFASTYIAPPRPSRPHSNSVSSLTNGSSLPLPPSSLPGSSMLSPYGYPISNASPMASLVLPSTSFNGSFGLGIAGMVGQGNSPGSATVIGLRPSFSNSLPDGRYMSGFDTNTSSSSSVYGLSTMDRERDFVREQRERDQELHRRGNDTQHASPPHVKIEEDANSPRLHAINGFRSRASSLMQSVSEVVTHISPGSSSSGFGPDRSHSERKNGNGTRNRRSSSGASKNGIAIAHSALPYPSAQAGQAHPNGRSSGRRLMIATEEGAARGILNNGDGDGLLVGSAGSVGGASGGTGEAMDSNAVRRLAHLQCEQRRRESINGGFAHLRTILPETSPADSKAAILQKAINYIQNLEQIVRASTAKADTKSTSPYIEDSAATRKRRRSTKTDDRRDVLFGIDTRSQAISPPLAARFAEMTTLVPPLMKEEDEDVAMMSDDEDEVDISPNSGSRSVSISRTEMDDHGEHGHGSPLDLLVGVADSVRRASDEKDKEKELNKNRVRVQIVAGQVEKKYEGHGASWAPVEVNV